MTTSSAPGFIIHAAGSLGNRPDLGKTPYRLKCRFRVGAYPSERVLTEAKFRSFDLFVDAMAKQGFDYIGESSRLPEDERGVRMVFKGAHVAIMNMHRPKRRLTSKEMLPQVMQGARFLPEEETHAAAVPHYTEVEFWDFELSAIFLRDTMLMEYVVPNS